jgi:2-keto-4-pentenoate hydratase
MRTSSKARRIGRFLSGLAFVTGVAVATSAIAEACPAESKAVAVAAQWRLRAPIAALDIADESQAVCFRQAFLAALRPDLGARIGYKVGMFSPAARKAFGIDRPRFGELYAKMLVPEGQAIPADFGGFGGVWESDLLLVVGDAGLNTARTREEAYASLRGFRPFIELTSRNYVANLQPTADQIAALDVGARLGVAGPEYPLARTPDGLAALENLTVEAIVRDESGARTDQAVGRESLGDPLDIVLFARDALRAEGGSLQPGDLISLGIYTPARVPAAGQVVTVRYHLLAQPVSVSAEFR